MNRRFGIVALVFLAFSAQAYAASSCDNMDLIKKAAATGYDKKDHASAEADPVYEGTTKTGKDKWTVQMNVDEECMTTAIVYTKPGSCKVLGVVGIPIGDGSCG